MIFCHFWFNRFKKPRNVLFYVCRCTIENRVGDVQWTRDEFGLGMGRDLPHYPRYTIIGNPELGKERNPEHLFPTFLEDGDIDLL